MLDILFWLLIAPAGIALAGLAVVGLVAIYVAHGIGGDR